VRPARRWGTSRSASLGFDLDLDLGVQQKIEIARPFSTNRT
jgi:hypothetical protein